MHACAALAAAAHRQRYESNRAEGSAVNRSTFLWALGRLDETVRSALEKNQVGLEDFTGLLGIIGDPEPLTGTFELSADLARAVRSGASAGRGRSVTPAMLAVAVLQDVQDNTSGLLGERLVRLGGDPGAILGALRSSTTDTGGGASSSTSDVPLVRVRDLTPRRFGVQLPPDADRPGPYVARDADHELERLLSARSPVVTVIAPPLSGAIRAVFEALRRVLPDGQVLLVHELVAGEGRSEIGPDDLDRLRSSGADVVWVRNLRELLDSSPVFEEWFRQRGDTLTASLVVVLRPEDRSRAAELGLVSDAVVELSDRLSVDEQERARDLYGRELGTVTAIASAASEGQGGVRANYAADSAAAARLLDESSDDLDIRVDVDMLAKLIASKDVNPPLSIGLFGPWGSGKSFFMRQVQLRIEDLAVRSRVTDDDATGYLREVVPVEFNAWQYAHGSALWASLINRVFEGIQERLGGDERYQKVLRDIAAKNVGVVDAHKRLEEARTEVEQARPAAGDRAIQEVADAHDDITEGATRTLNETLNLDAATDQVSDLRNEVDALTTTTARLRKGWSTASSARRIAVVSVVIVGLVVLGLVTFVPAALQPLTALVAAVGSLAAAATQVLKPVNQGLEQASKLLRADDADKENLQRAQDNLDEATRQLAEAKASGLAGLYGFVSDRSAAAEYRQHLGMAPMIRDDLKRLADISRSVDGLPGIDRIVIFIDDLDRCPASEVVRVLEAVNLLFGFELFVVVVAVDSRWLLRSLEGTFSEAFDADDGPAPTPQNYLEKIIQIPFWLRPMQPAGFGRLLTTLAGEVDGVRDDRGTELGGEPGLESGADMGSPWQDASPFHTAEPIEAEETETEAASATDSAEPETDEQAEEDRPEDDLNPQALRLTTDERDFMLTFLPLVGTPRAVKRFLNTYQLLRVSVDDVATFLGSEEYRSVLILLALMTGTAPLTEGMIGELRSMNEATFELFLESRAEVDGWQQIASACEDLPTATLTPAVIAAWLSKVARYSFHPVEA